MLGRTLTQDWEGKGRRNGEKSIRYLFGEAKQKINTPYYTKVQFSHYGREKKIRIACPNV